MNDRSPEQDIELKPKAAKASRENDSSRAAIRGARKGSSIWGKAYRSRLAKPGYVAACHSRKPEAMVKVVSDPPRGYAVRRLLHYIARVDKPMDPTTPEALAGHETLWIRDQDGRVYSTAEEIEALAKSWAESFNPDLERARVLRGEKKALLLKLETAGDEHRSMLQKSLARTEAKLRAIAQKPSMNAQLRAGRARRDVAHIVLSAKAANDEISRQRALTAAEKTAERFFANHDYALGLHQDGKYPHVHIIVKSQSKQLEDGEEKGHGKLRLNKPELLQLRTLWAKALTEEGLEHVATLREDRPHVMQDIAAGKANLKGQRKAWFAASIQGLDEGLQFLEKRQGDLQKALERAEGRKEAAEIRKEIGTRLNELRGQIRAKTVKGDKARAAAFAELKRIERSLERKADPLLQLKELAEKSGHHRPVYQMILRAVETNPRPRARAQTPGLDYEAQAALSFAQERIAAAWGELKKGGLTREQYKLSAQVLSIHEQEVNKAFGLYPGAGKSQQRPTAKPEQARPQERKKTNEIER